MTPSSLRHRFEPQIWIVSCVALVTLGCLLIHYRPRHSATSFSDAPKFVPELLAWGAGPRASQYLILGGKARAVLHGRVHVTTDDIKLVAAPVLRHRIMTTFHADADGVTTDDLIRKLIESTPVPLDAKKL